MIVNNHCWAIFRQMFDSLNLISMIYSSMAVPHSGHKTNGNLPKLDIIASYLTPQNATKNTFVIPTSWKIQTENYLCNLKMNNDKLEK